MIPMLENQLPAHLAAGAFGHHHDVRRVARVGGKPFFCSPFCESIERLRETIRIPCLISTDLYNDFRHEAPEVPTPTAAALCVSRIVRLTDPAAVQGGATTPFSKSQAN